MRFLLVLVSLIAVCAAVYFTVLFWGQGRPIARFDHAFDIKGKPYVIVPWDSGLDVAKLRKDASGKMARVTVATWIDP